MIVRQLLCAISILSPPLICLAQTLIPPGVIGCNVTADTCSTLPKCREIVGKMEAQLRLALETVSESEDCTIREESLRLELAEAKASLVQKESAIGHAEGEIIACKKELSSLQGATQQSGLELKVSELEKERDQLREELRESVDAADTLTQMQNAMATAAEEQLKNFKIWQEHAELKLLEIEEGRDILQNQLKDARAAILTASNSNTALQSAQKEVESLEELLKDERAARISAEDKLMAMEQELEAAGSQTDTLSTIEQKVTSLEQDLLSAKDSLHKAQTLNNDALAALESTEAALQEALDVKSDLEKQLTSITSDRDGHKLSAATALRDIEEAESKLEQCLLGHKETVLDETDKDSQQLQQCLQSQRSVTQAASAFQAELDECSSKYSKLTEMSTLAEEQLQICLQDTPKTQTFEGTEGGETVAHSVVLKEFETKLGECVRNLESLEKIKKNRSLAESLEEDLEECLWSKEKLVEQLEKAKAENIALTVGGHSAGVGESGVVIDTELKTCLQGSVDVEDLENKLQVCMSSEKALSLAARNAIESESATQTLLAECQAQAILQQNQSSSENSQNLVTSTSDNLQEPPGVTLEGGTDVVDSSQSHFLRTTKEAAALAASTQASAVADAVAQVEGKVLEWRSHSLEVEEELATVSAELANIHDQLKKCMAGGKDLGLAVHVLPDGQVLHTNVLQDGESVDVCGDAVKNALAKAAEECEELNKHDLEDISFLTSQLEDCRKRNAAVDAGAGSVGAEACEKTLEELKAKSEGLERQLESTERSLRGMEELAMEDPATDKDAIVLQLRAQVDELSDLAKNLQTKLETAQLTTEGSGAGLRQLSVSNLVEDGWSLFTATASLMTEKLRKHADGGGKGIGVTAATMFLRFESAIETKLQPKAGEAVSSINKVWSAVYASISTRATAAGASEGTTRHITIAAAALCIAVLLRIVYIIITSGFSLLFAFLALPFRICRRKKGSRDGNHLKDE